MAERSDDCSSDEDTDSDPVEDPPLLVGPHKGEDQQSTEQQRSGDTGRQVQGVVTESASSTRLSLVNRYCGFSGPIHIPQVDKVPTCILEKRQQHDITRPDNQARSSDDEIKLADNVKSYNEFSRPGKIVRPDEKAQPESLFRPDDNIKPDDEFRPEEKVSLDKARTEDEIRIDVEVTTDDKVKPYDRVRPDNEVRLDGIKMADKVRQGDKIRSHSEVRPHHEVRTDEQVRPTPLQSGVNTDSEEDCVLQGDIFEAAQSGDVQTVKNYLDLGIPPDLVDEQDWSILHHAASHGQVDVMRLLHFKGCSVNPRDRYRRTPLHHAASSGACASIGVLIEELGSEVNPVDNDGFTPLKWSVQCEQYAAMEDLLRCGGVVEVSSIVNVECLDDETKADVLFQSAITGDVQVVSAVLDSGCPIDVKDDLGWNALHWAALGGALEMVSFLINCGLDVNQGDKNGVTALHVAAEKGPREVVSALVDAGCPIDVKICNGENALHYAAIVGVVEMVSFLIKCGLDVKSGNKTGDTALHVAAYQGHQEVVSALVNAGCLIDVESHTGWNALHYAAMGGAVEMVSFLVKCGLDVKSGNKTGDTALHVAAYQGHQEVVSALVNAGCPIDVVESDGQSVLHYAAAGAGAIGFMKDLLEGGYNLHVNDEDKEGATPLHFACAASKPHAACELVRHGALLTTVAGRYGTPLHQAADTSLIDDLLKSQARHLFPDNTNCNPLNVCDSFGHTPAFWAAGGGHITNLERFVANNCDIRVRSNIMFSIFEYAIQAGEIGQLQAIVKACGIDDGCTSQRELLRSLQARDLLDPSKLLILGAIGGEPLVIDSLSSEEDMFTAAARQVWSDTHCRMFLDYHYRPRKGAKESIYDSLCLPSACPLTPLQIAVICLKYRIEYCEENGTKITVTTVAIAQTREYIQKLITHPVSKPTVNVQFQNGLSPLDVAQQFGLCDIADMIESAGGRPGKWADLPKEHSVGILEVYCSLKILKDANPAAVSRIVEQFFPQLARERILDSKPQLDAVINHVLPNLRCLESWFEVGGQLGITMDMLKALEKEYGSEKRTAYRKMLTLWLQNVCSLVSWKRLFDVLDDFELGRTVKEIKTKILEELQPLKVSSPPTPSSALMPLPPPSTHGVSLCRPALHRSREAVHPHQRLMDKYRDRFLKVVPAKELALRWYNDQLVSEEVYHEIKPEQVAPSTARNVLFRYFWDHGTPQFFEKAFCQIMVEEGQKGYPQAARLGRDLQEDLVTQLSPHH